MYVMSVPQLLDLDQLIPHEVALRRGLLSRFDASMAGRLILVSHQWLGFTEPDPDGRQFACRSEDTGGLAWQGNKRYLQQILRDLQQGTLPRVGELRTIRIAHLPLPRSSRARQASGSCRQSDALPRTTADLSVHRGGGLRP